MGRAAKCLAAVALTALLAAPAPASATAEPAPAAAPATVAAPPVPAPVPARSAAPGPAPAPAATPLRRPVRGLEIAVPAYGHADDPLLAELTGTGPAASVVVLNPGNGDAPFDAGWQARADALRRGVTATGEHTKVLGYVHTDHGLRDRAAVEASVDNYLRTGDGRLHVDGIFFDVVSRDCGPADRTRDHYLALRRHVQAVMHAVDPAVPDLVVDNPGTPIADCYLAPGRRTADIFVTFEDTYAAYTGGGWSGGNVFNAAEGYHPGTALDPTGTAFWHLVHGVPDRAAMRATLRTAFGRGAGYAYAAGAGMPNPWDTAPAWGFRPETGYAATIG